MTEAPPQAVRSTWAPARLAAWRRSWLAMDRDPRAIAFAKSAPGVVALHLAFFALLALGPRFRPALLAAAVVTLTGCALWPHRRAWLIGLPGLALLFLRPYRTESFYAVPSALERSLGAASSLDLTLVVALATGLFLLLSWTLLELQVRRRDGVVARRPVATLLVLFFGLVGLAEVGPLGGTGLVFLWSFLALAASTFWFLAYALAECRARDATPTRLRLGFFRPFWGGGTTPVGKGPGYLKKFEAKNEDELAVTRLKALKLGVWGLLLGRAHGVLLPILAGTCGLPPLKQALRLLSEGVEVPLYQCWASLIQHYLLGILRLAAMGHVIVSTIRMAGYRIPRNTVRPLASRTLAEFWNRYYFYFKELLVDFFFYPAFLRYFKKQRRLRLACATLCAACCGNFLYHFILEIHHVATRGLLEALRAFESYGVYCLALAAGLIVSQLRGRRPAPADGVFRYQILPRLNVALFFCLLGIFDDTSGTGTLQDRVAFLFHLVGAT